MGRTLTFVCYSPIMSSLLPSHSMPSSPHFTSSTGMPGSGFIIEKKTTCLLTVLHTSLRHDLFKSMDDDRLLIYQSSLIFGWMLRGHVVPGDGGACVLESIPPPKFMRIELFLRSFTLRFFPRTSGSPSLKSRRKSLSILLVQRMQVMQNKWHSSQFVRSHSVSKSFHSVPIISHPSCTQHESNY